jgi:hypothetical protein
MIGCFSVKGGVFFKNTPDVLQNHREENTKSSGRKYKTIGEKIQNHQGENTKPSGTFSFSPPFFSIKGSNFVNEKKAFLALFSHIFKSQFNNSRLSI